MGDAISRQRICDTLAHRGPAVGVDIFKPVPQTAKGMDPARVKQENRRDIAFWSGSVDAQAILGRSAPPEVRERLRRNTRS